MTTNTHSAADGRTISEQDAAIEIRAKPLEWQAHPEPPKSPNSWEDKQYMGFHIHFEPDEPSDQRYRAAWGEGDYSEFATLAEAQQWCQDEADRWIRKSALVSFAPHMAPSVPDGWRPIDTAPKETPVEGLCEDGSTDIVQWQGARQCMLSSVARGAGECGPGWVSIDIGHLPVDEPKGWRPIDRVGRHAASSVDGLADRIVKDVAELSDRSSPEDWPGAMLVTADELRLIVTESLIAAAPQPADSVARDSAGPLDGKYGEVLRPFVAMMERELHANAGKGDRPGWLGMSAATAMLEIYYHAAKLQRAVKNGGGDEICEYAADVANMAMMMMDICGGLTNAPAAQEG